MQNLWKVYRHLMGKQKSKNTSSLNKLVTDTQTVTGDKNIANAFNEYFCSVGGNLAKSFPNNDIISNI